MAGDVACHYVRRTVDRGTGGFHSADWTVYGLVCYFDVRCLIFAGDMNLS